MYWLLVERYDNWKVDENSGFLQLGVSPKKLPTAQRMEKGDVLVTYVSGIKAFSDVREITSDAPIKLKVKYDYDEPFAMALNTKPLVVLEESNWLSIYEVLEKLSFTKGKKRWSNYFYHQLKHLSEENAKMLITEINKLKECSK